jgi:hypothetical protein
MWDPGTGSSRANYIGIIAPSDIAGTLTFETAVDEDFTEPIAIYFEGAAALVNAELSADQAYSFGPTPFRYLRVTSSDDESVNTAVIDEAVGNSDADSSTTDTLAETPILPGSVVITVGDGVGGAAQVYTDPAGDGILVGSPAGSGVIDYATGVETINGVSAANQGEAIVASYRLNVGEARTVTYFRVTA